MTALTIDNLAIDNALDSAAMNAVIGGGRVGWEYRGTTFSQTGFKFIGRSSRLVGMANIGGQRVRKYATSYKYRNVQYKTKHYYEFWK